MVRKGITRSPGRKAVTAAPRLCDRAGALDAENVRHVEAEVAGDAVADVEVEMVEAHRLQIDEDVFGADRRRLDVFVDELLRPAVTVDDDGLHACALRFAEGRRLRAGYSASATLSLWSASGGPLSSTVLPSGSVR